MQETKASSLNVSEGLFNYFIYTYGRKRKLKKREANWKTRNQAQSTNNVQCKKKKKTLQNRRKRKFQCSLPRLQSWVRDGVIKRLQVTLSLNLHLILIISSFATSMEYVLKETTSWALSQCFRTKLNYKKNISVSKTRIASNTVLVKPKES